MKSLNQFEFVELLGFKFYLLSEMTDMENIDSTEEKKNHWAAMREKYDGQISDLQAKLDAEIAGRAADKKLYFGNTMKSKGYEGDFNDFADKYSNLSIDDMVSLYEWQHGKVSVVTEWKPEQPAQQAPVWPQSDIAWANPTAEVGQKSLKDMKPDEIIAYAKTQSWYHNWI